LDDLFIKLFKQSELYNEDKIFWDTVADIFIHIKITHSTHFFIVLDQINEVKKEKHSGKNNFEWMKEKLDKINRSEV